MTEQDQGQGGQLSDATEPDPNAQEPVSGSEADPTPETSTDETTPKGEGGPEDVQADVQDQGPEAHDPGLPNAAGDVFSVGGPRPGQADEAAEPTDGREE